MMVMIMVMVMMMVMMMEMVMVMMVDGTYHNKLSVSPTFPLPNKPSLL